MSEQDLVKQSEKYLTEKKLFWWRNNVGRRGKMKFGKNGSPDIYLLRDGKLIGIEFKVGYNKQSEDQIKWERKMKQHGGEYWLIYNIEELLLKTL